MKTFFKVSDYHFIAVWELADSIETVAHWLARPVRWVIKRKRRLLERMADDGLELKKLPRRAPAPKVVSLVPSAN